MITKRCNLSCPYCFANDYVNDGSQNFDIDMASFNEILEFILRDGSQKKLALLVVNLQSIRNLRIYSERPLL